MSPHRIITENRLDEWVRGNTAEAQGVVPELVFRLVAASSPNPKERRFPLGDSVGQPGPDGYLNTDFGFNPFVPEGKSYWEFGTGNDAADKATKDYRELTMSTPVDVRQDSAFVFVTPLSGRRDWKFTWKEESQARWLEDRRQQKDWRDVYLIDGTRLIDWLSHFPAVESWLATTMGFPSSQVQTAEQRWEELRTIGDPPPLIPDLFLANREAAQEKLIQAFSGATRQLMLDTRYPDQMANFVAATVAAMDVNAKVDAVGRCLIISEADAWEASTALGQAHVLVADFDLDNADSSGTRLLEKALRRGHTVILGGMPGGIPHPNRVTIPSPKSHQVKEALEKAGYNAERARVLAQKSEGNLSFLLRYLHNLSTMPEWAQDNPAAELAIAELLGSWREDSEADKAVAEKLLGNRYGEWIAKMREVALRPATPLIQRNAVWKVVARYEGWYVLGRRLFDEHLDRFREAVVGALRERDPKFELSSDNRFAATIQGKVLSHSHTLRNGLAESLALLGSHPKALSSCSFGKAEATATLAVREILADSDWVLWASLNNLLPLLAEAAPGAFLDAVEHDIASTPCPFDQVFAQEDSGLMGSNYMTGLLWALETLAWDSEYLTRVTVVLGELAARDPGGRWSNRPANSLATILLPWLPQTCSPAARRQGAVATLLKELPEVGWKLLLRLLPQVHQVSSGSRRPEWREIISDDWSNHVTIQEFWDQVIAYSEMAIDVARSDSTKLAELIRELGELPEPVRDRLLDHLQTNIVRSLPQVDRLPIWKELVDIVSQHRKFADADWALEPGVIDKIATVAQRLLPEDPQYRHQRLFSERGFDLYEEKGDYERQREELEARRQSAIMEIFDQGGVGAVLEFAQAVDSPWRVGIAFGLSSENGMDEEILPALLESQKPSLDRFVGGYVSGRFLSGAWQWVDELDTTNWTSSQKGQFLAFLPFTADCWERSARLLRDDESAYWLKVNANPYEAEHGLELAVERLLEYGRSGDAVRCLYGLRHDQRPLSIEQVVRVLKAVAVHPEDAGRLDAHAIVKLIEALQDDPSTNAADLFQIEWWFLPLLDRLTGSSPRLLEQKMAEDPEFYCEVISAVFRSDKEDSPEQKPNEQQVTIATNGYRLLNNWRTPPGTQRDGTYNGEVLNRWMREVRASCEESGHLNIALQRVGHALRYAPPDPDGLWIHRGAAAALNAKDAGQVREGFVVEFYNSRGVRWHSGGEEERELAVHYRQHADAVEAQGYHRLAASLRELAADYVADAEREASRDPFEI